MPRIRVTRLAATGVLTTALVTSLVAGCAAPSGPEEAASASPSATTPTLAATDAPDAPDGAALPDVPVRSADLGALAAEQAAEPAAQPTRLRVDALGIDIPLDPVGVAPDGQMEVPPYAERGGWYRFGAAPGDDAGTVVVAAHVDSVVSEGLGPFAALVDAQPGQVAVVDLADGTQVTYAITAREAQPKPEVAWPEVFDRTGPPRLVLITCGGGWRSDVRSYTDNVLVTAAPEG